jgi:hypothetical protein
VKCGIEEQKFMYEPAYSTYLSPGIS